MKELLEIRNDTNKEGTVQQIKDGISMQGHTAWILVFSILIASIGLNANSAAVVIGAMLISPLMGPILGVGMSIGINDIDTLRNRYKETSSYEMSNERIKGYIDTFIERVKEVENNGE